jgi:hypothetical protein
MEVFDKWFAPDGRPLITMEKLRMEIFRRGVSNRNNARRRLWPYLLGVYAWDVTEDERQRLREDKMCVCLTWVWSFPTNDCRQETAARRRDLDVPCGSNKVRNAQSTV